MKATMVFGAMAFFAIGSLGVFVGCGDDKTTGGGEETDSGGDADADADADADTDADTDADADTDSEPDSDTDTSVDTGFTVEGVVKRSAPLSKGGDGKGTLCLTVIEECPSQQNQTPKVLKGAYGQVKDVDLSAKDAQVNFTIPAAGGYAQNDKTYYVTGFLSEAGADCTKADFKLLLPVKGDPISFITPATEDVPCPEFVYKKGQDVSDLVLDLNTTMPF